MRKIINSFLLSILLIAPLGCSNLLEKSKKEFESYLDLSNPLGSELASRDYCQVLEAYERFISVENPSPQKINVSERLFKTVASVLDYSSYNSESLFFAPLTKSGALEETPMPTDCVAYAIYYYDTDRYDMDDILDYFHSNLPDGVICDMYPNTTVPNPSEMLRVIGLYYPSINVSQYEPSIDDVVPGCIVWYLANPQEHHAVNAIGKINGTDTILCYDHQNDRAVIVPISHVQYIFY